MGMKRAFDFVISLIGLVILLPVFLIIGIAIKLDGDGPVIFRQKRIGRHGKHFIIFKFRSMSLLKLAEDGIFEPGDDARITSIGRILRKSKLDELPQLYNVLKGEMSLVGPRPEIEKWINQYPERWEKILTVRPGITDNASIEFRNEDELYKESDSPEDMYRNIILPRKLDLYEEYIETQSFSRDIKLILKTLFQVFKNDVYNV